MKTLLEIKTLGGERPILTVELDGKIAYHDPMKPEELKKAIDYAIENKLPAAESLAQMLFASELARLSSENAELKKRLEGAPRWCSGCGQDLGPGVGIHLCGGRGFGGPFIGSKGS